MYGRNDWQRRKIEDDHRRRILNLDWTKFEDVKWRLDDLYSDNPMNVTSVRHAIDDEIRRGKLPLELALQWVASHSPRHHERLIKECMASFVYKIETHEQQVSIMNRYALFALLSEYERRRIMEAVLENGDLTDLGVTWFSHFTHLQDQLRLQPIRNAMEQTHAIESLFDGGDATVRRVDAWLVDRLEKGLGAPANASKLTGEFFAAAAVIPMPGTPKHLAVQLASEAILKLVGAMPWASRQLGADVSWRNAHTELKVLDWLIARIAGVMTDENAGLVLRWAMVGKRHHDWVRDRLTKAAEHYGWRLVTIVESDGTPVATWKTGNRIYRVLQAAEPEKIGELRIGGRAWVPRSRYLGDPVESSPQLAVYRAPLHPATPPTEAMKNSPDLFPL